MPKLKSLIILGELLSTSTPSSSEVLWPNIQVSYWGRCIKCHCLHESANKGRVDRENGLGRGGGIGKEGGVCRGWGRQRGWGVGR